jgi:hypothetical protein
MNDKSSTNTNMQVPPPWGGDVERALVAQDRVLRAQRVRGFFEERPLPQFEVDTQVLHHRTRRDVLLFGAAALAALEVLDHSFRKIRSRASACVEG